MSDEWAAYCAPGRKPIVEMLAVLRPEKVTEVIEHPWLAGRTDYLLVKAGAVDCPGSAPVEAADPPLPRCPWCRGAGRHYTWCYAVPPA